MFATEPMLLSVREQYERRKWAPLLSRQKTGSAAARCTETDSRHFVTNSDPDPLLLSRQKTAQRAQPPLAAGSEGAAGDGLKE